MSFFDGVTPQTVSQASDGFLEFKVGENYAYISSVEEKESRNNNPMLEITFADEEGATIRYWIVGGEYKLSRLKQLYSAFGIPMGEANTNKWIGKWGVVVCKAGTPNDKGKVYNQVSYLKQDNADKQPQGSASSKPSQNEGHGDDEYFEDDIPF